MTWISLGHRIYLDPRGFTGLQNIKINKFIHRLQYLILKRYLKFFYCKLTFKKLKLTREFGKLVKTVKMNSVLGPIKF